MTTFAANREIVDPKTKAGDLARRATSVMLSVVGVALLYLGVHGFSEVTTDAFNWAGYIALPLGVFGVMIFLLPLIACVHRLWVAGDAELRRKRLERAARDHAVARLSTSHLRSKKPEGSMLGAMAKELSPGHMMDFEPAPAKHKRPPWFAGLVMLILTTGAVLAIASPPTAILVGAVAVWTVTGVGLASAH